MSLHDACQQLGYAIVRRRNGAPGTIYGVDVKEIKCTSCGHADPDFRKDFHALYCIVNDHKTGDAVVMPYHFCPKCNHADSLPFQLKNASKEVVITH